MKYVKKIEAETVLGQIEVSNGTVGFKTQQHVSYGIFENDKIVFTNGQYEIYSRKSAAEKQAEWLNRNKS